MEVSMRSQARGLCAVALSFSTGLLLAGFAAAGDFDVNSVLDEVDDNPGNGSCHTASGHCSLRAAVMEANRVVDGSKQVTIELPAGTYFLTLAPTGGNGDESGDLDLPLDAKPIVISGAGAATTIIDAGAIDDRVFNIGTARVVSLVGFALRNGLAAGASGGAIQNHGELTMAYCTLSGNSAHLGGAIYTTARDPTVGNDVTVTLSRLTVSGNSATYGGGIFNGGDDLKLERSTLSGNSATLDGGGIHNEGIGIEYVANSTISHNQSIGDGGGIYNSGTTWTYNATIAFNEADADGLEGGAGGGIHNTVTGNFYPRNSLIVGNTHSGSPDLDDCDGTLGAFGQNWYSDVGECTCVAQNPQGACSPLQTLAEIGPLRFNGGSTQTHALVAPTSIIDSGIATINLGDPPVDQRGALRDIIPDSGAFEYGALAVGLIFADGFELGNLWGWG
jgi:CSLREA domain-containing protein